MDNTNQNFIDIDYKNILIGVLVVLLVCSFLGIPILQIIGQYAQIILQNMIWLLEQLVRTISFVSGQLLRVTGLAIETTGDVMEDTGQVLVNSAQNQQQHPQQQNPQNQPQQNQQNTQQALQQYGLLSNPIGAHFQQPKSANGWCLVGEYQGERGCMHTMELNGICQSGQIYATKNQCEQPETIPAQNQPTKV